MNKLSTSWGRMLLACAAVLAVAGSGVVFASSVGATYARPKFASVTGPGSLAPNSITAYTLTVTFVDGTSGTFVSPLVTWTASSGTWSASDYTAPATAGNVLLSGMYTSAGATVNAHRAVVIQ